MLTIGSQTTEYISTIPGGVNSVWWTRILAFLPRQKLKNPADESIECVQRSLHLNTKISLVLYLMNETGIRF